MAPTRPKASGVARQLSADAGTERHGSVWNLASPPASCRSEIAGSHLTITQMVVDGKGLQEEAFRARQEAGISQGVAAITEQLPRQADDDWVDVFCTATGPGTSGMLVGATPNASRAAAGTPHNIVNALFPRQIESFRACGQGLRVDFDASDSDEDIGDEKSDAVCDMAREWFLDIVGHHNSEAERRSSRRAQDLSVTHHICMHICTYVYAHIYQYKYISICIFKRVCVLCACVNVHLYVFMCMCLSLCVCVCMCVCK